MQIAKIVFQRIILLSFLVAAPLRGSDRAERLTADARALESAAGAYDARFVDVPIGANVGSCEILVEGYREGKVFFQGRSPGSGYSTITMNPPQYIKALSICVCLRTGEPSEVIVEGTNKLRRIAGTGSTRLGYSFTLIEKDGRGGTAGYEIMPHAQFDFMAMHEAMTCEDLPFKILPRQGDKQAIPVVVYFPRKVDVTSLKGQIDALKLPDGTVVVYAVIKKS